MTDFYVVSLKHTQKRHPCISFWRPNNSGYAWPMPWFGRYGEDQVRKETFYYNDGFSTLAVPCGAIEPLLASPPAGVIDGDAGPVVGNTRHARETLFDLAIRSTAEHKSKNPPERRHEFDGHTAGLKRIGELLLGDGLDRKVRMDLWKARSAILTIGYYGSPTVGQTSTAFWERQSSSALDRPDGVLKTASRAIARAEQKLVVQPLMFRSGC